MGEANLLPGSSPDFIDDNSSFEVCLQGTLLKTLSPQEESGHFYPSSTVPLGIL